MGNVLLINTAALAAMFIVGFVFSIWFTRHDNLEVI